VGDRELERASQFSANPVQGIEARTATAILPGHLSYDNFRIGENVDRPGFQGYGTLQGFEESEVFGYVIVLPPDPLGDADLTAI